MRHTSLGLTLVGALCALVACGGASDSDKQTGASGAAGDAVGGSATGGSGNGTAGTGGTKPGDPAPPQALTKLDLLLMVDNSRNMLEKQRLLLDALTPLLDQITGSLGIQDIHVGVVTSSLGAHGSADPHDVCVQPSDDDHAHLLGEVRGLTTWNNSGFLTWDPAQAATPPGAASLPMLEEQLKTIVDAAGDHGCGYEGSFESWYRFLVDPEPPLAVVVPAGASTAMVQGVDQTVLAQRQAFLRPDSVVSIVMLSDENDCSIVDGGYGWLVSRASSTTGISTMYAATSQCATDPNSPCCRSCGETVPKTGCPDVLTDSVCMVDQHLPTTDSSDSLNLRCWDQKRRFGIDLLYPISRYVDALTRPMIASRSGAMVQNPLFAAGTKRQPSQVVLTGIVGVPWQDLADDASLGGAGLTFLTSSQLLAADRWQVMLGDDSVTPRVRPLDPFMVESSVDRSPLGLPPHPLVPSQQIVPPTSTNPEAAINGHESLYDRSMQYACTFQRQQPITCDDAALQSSISCECEQGYVEYNIPLCQPPGGGPTGIQQYYDGAFPGVRHLQLLRALGDNAVVGSACPKVLDESLPDYGYRPATRALGARLAQAFNP